MLDDIAQWSRIASVLIVLAQGILAWVLWSMRKQYVSREHCDKQCKNHAEKLAEVEQRQAKLETTQSNAPTAKDMNEIKEQLSQVSGGIQALNATTSAQSNSLKGVAHQLNILIENEITGGKG